MGKRARGPIGEQKLVMVGCALDPAVRSTLARMADEEQRSLSSIIRALINEALQQQAQHRAQQTGAAAPSCQ